MNAESFQIRKLTSEDLTQYNGLLRYAFQVTEKSLQEIGWEDDEIKQSKFPVLERANVWGCFDGGSLISQFAAYPLEMNIHGAVCPIAFITSVSTYPEYSGMGLMSRLMKQSLWEMRESGQTLALLYPYSIPLYRKKGWEIVSDKMSYQIRDVQLPRSIQVPGHVPAGFLGGRGFYEPPHPLRLPDPRMSVPQPSGLGRVLAVGRGRHHRGGLLPGRRHAFRLHGLPDQRRHHAHQGNDLPGFRVPERSVEVYRRP